MMSPFDPTVGFHSKATLPQVMEVGLTPTISKPPGSGFTEGDVKTAVRMLPYSNLFAWRIMLGDLPENIAVDFFDVPKTRKSQ